MTEAAAPDRLDPRPWMTAAPTLAVLEALQRAGGPSVARFVGGCVRDALLDRDRPDMDIDIATPLRPPEVTQALERAGLRAVPTGADHGTITALADHRPFEITTLRRDVETDGRRAVVAFTTDWAEDAARRDFRLNALYAEPDGRLHDPTGGGVADALAGRIVFVGDPETRIREDYLRILRFFRFYAAYGRGEADANALAACARLKDGLQRLSGERVSRELMKLLAAPDPGPAVRLMVETGVLAVLLPMGFDLARFEGLLRLERMGDIPIDPELRLAALLPPDRQAITAAAVRLRLPNALRDRLLAAPPDNVRLSAGMTPPETRAAIYRLGGRTAQDRARLAWAASPDPEREAAGWRTVLELAGRWTPPPFPVTGAEIKAAGVAEGPDVGRIRRDLESWWIAGDFAADRAAALQRLAELTGTPEPDASS